MSDEQIWYGPLTVTEWKSKFEEDMGGLVSESRGMLRLFGIVPTMGQRMLLRQEIQEAIEKYVCAARGGRHYQPSKEAVTLFLYKHYPSKHTTEIPRILNQNWMRSAVRRDFIEADRVYE